MERNKWISSSNFIRTDMLYAVHKLQLQSEVSNELAPSQLELVSVMEFRVHDDNVYFYNSVNCFKLEAFVIF